MFKFGIWMLCEPTKSPKKESDGTRWNLCQWTRLLMHSCVLLHEVVKLLSYLSSKPQIQLTHLHVAFAHPWHPKLHIYLPSLDVGFGSCLKKKSVLMWRGLPSSSFDWGFGGMESFPLLEIKRTCVSCFATSLSGIRVCIWYTYVFVLRVARRNPRIIK